MQINPMLNIVAIIATPKAFMLWSLPDWSEGHSAAVTHWICVSWLLVHNSKKGLHSSAFFHCSPEFIYNFKQVLAVFGTCFHCFDLSLFMQFMGILKQKLLISQRQSVIYQKHNIFSKQTSWKAYNHEMKFEWWMM